MSTSRLSKDEIFNAAAEITDSDERASYIARECGDDSELRAEIEELLKHDEGEDSLLDRTFSGFRQEIGAFVRKTTRILRKPSSTM